MTASGFTDQGSLVHDNLMAGDFPVHSKLVTITGGDYVRGAALGKVTVGGKYTLSASASTDGSQTIAAILAEDAAAAGGDVQAVVMFTGEFNEDAITFGVGHSADSVRDALRGYSIFLRKNLGA